MFGAYCSRAVAVPASAPPDGKGCDACVKGKFTNYNFISQHTNTHRPNSKREGKHLAHVTVASFSCSRHGTRAALTDTDQFSFSFSFFAVCQKSPIPRVNPGSEPRCNHLAWLACGPWRTHKHNTYDHIAWLASEERGHLPHRGRSEANLLS